MNRRICGARAAGRISGVATEFADRLREAADAYVAGDVEPFVALLHPDVEWIGRTRGYLWWRSTPS